MSALVCGKRPQFEDLSSPGSSPPSATQKRARYRGSPSHYVPGVVTPAPGEVTWASATTIHEKLLVLHQLFPSMNSEDLQRALEECGHDLDLTIEGLNLLCLAPSERGRDSDARSRSHGSPEERKATASASVPPGVPAASGHAESSEHSAVDRAAAAAAAAAQDHEGAGGAAVLDTYLSQQASSAAEGRGEGAEALASVLSVEWVDAVVQEMMSARDLDDARQRAARVLQTFGSAAIERAGSAKEQEVQHLKQQLNALQRDNLILKRAVAIQHERQQAHEAREAEVNSLKHMLEQYQEQLRKLEMNNYALSLHLQKAQVDNSMPNRFHPDVF